MSLSIARAYPCGLCLVQTNGQPINFVLKRQENTSATYYKGITQRNKLVEDQESELPHLQMYLFPPLFYCLRPTMVPLSVVHHPTVLPTLRTLFYLLHRRRAIIILSLCLRLVRIPREVVQTSGLCGNRCNYVTRTSSSRQQIVIN